MDIWDTESDSLNNRSLDGTVASLSPPLTCPGWRFRGVTIGTGSKMIDGFHALAMRLDAIDFVI
jgi:hypothetical protein